jgi:AraC family transcriptional regulator, positive regulator of tynA and feaB
MHKAALNEMTLESSDFAGTPQLDYEAWRAFIRSDYGADAKVIAPHAFAAWIRPISIGGFAADAMKIESGFRRIERTQQEVQRVHMDYYRALFEVAGRAELIQNGQEVELGGGDVALVDMSRPAIFCSSGSAYSMPLLLPRQPLLSHFGFVPQGGLRGRGGALAMRLLHQIVRDAIEDEGSLTGPAGGYMRLMVYDLLGALFASSDPAPHQNTDKLFRRICGIIKDRFADPEFGPSEVAAEAGISMRYLQKLFTARGSTCTQFIHSLRLDHAAHLLQRRALLHTGQPLSDIAFACGFNDYPYFVLKFKQRFGYPPGAHAGVHDPRAVTLIPESTAGLRSAGKATAQA